jgi:hypothetical protein
VRYELTRTGNLCVVARGGGVTRYAVNVGPGKWLGSKRWKTVPFDRARVYTRKCEADKACANVVLYGSHGSTVGTVKVIQVAPC